MGGLGTLSCMSIDDTTLLMTASSSAGHASSGINGSIGGVGGGGEAMMMMGLGGHMNASMLKVSSEDWNEPWRNALDGSHGHDDHHGHSKGNIDGGGIQLGHGARAAAALMASNAADR